ncbi:MAG TPA: choice-of-anchor B family protein [Chitinophagales bacterium]|nr:choice-of-anchor B family protein [Chitinophagales bacterium]
MFCNTRFFTAALTRGFVLFICLIWGHLFPMFAQLNTELLGHIDYEQTVNDVWGYVANGHEYALLGTRTGTAIIDVTDPANPTELFFVPGPSSLWRDMKVWNNYAYVTNETDSGLHVFDLQYLPDSIQVWNWTGDIFMGDTVNMTSAHNVFIDENGIAYIFGSNYGVGGAIMIDVNANPINPPIVGIYNQRYVHDGFVRGDTLWTAEIYAGRFAVIDVTNKANPVIMATQNTPFAFAHNCWLSDDGNTFITTDEKSNAPITIYDVSDITDIKELAQYRSNPGSGVIPHNTFFRQNFMITSYYRDGATIVDATFPNAPVEVGYYDTSPLSGDNFNGCWGVYPYLPSGILLASDMEEGLFVIQPTYVQACYLQGNITNALTGAPLQGVQITISGTGSAQTTTNFSGNFQTGVAQSGSYTVTVSAFGYATQTFVLALENGELTPLNVALTPLPSFQLFIYVTDAQTGLPIPDVQALLESDNNTQTLFSNAEGLISAPIYDSETYQIYLGKWGYRTLQLNPYVTPENNVYTIPLTRGYYDDFLFDYGWTVSGNADNGIWVRAKPIGSTFAGNLSNVDADLPDDFGNYCFVTGNGGVGIGNNVNNGVTILTSPVFDLTGYTNPELRYHRYLSLQNGSNDTLFIELTNGIETVTVETVKDGDPYEYVFHQTIANITQLIQPTATMQLIARIADLPTSGNVVEAAFDGFEIVENITPTASFTTSGSAQGCLSAQVQFISTGTSGASTQWYFEGGLPEQSTSASPTVQYSQPGVYPVTLTVSTNSGNNSLTQTNFVTVYDAPTVEITEPLVPCQNQPFTLTAQTDAPISSYLWQGEGLLSNAAAEVQALVGLPDVQIYTLTVTDTNGCTANAALYLAIIPTPELALSADATQVCTGANVVLNASGNTEEWTELQWLVNDILVPDANQTQFITTIAENANITAVVTNGFCNASQTVNLTALPLPVIDVSAWGQVTDYMAPNEVCLNAPLWLNLDTVTAAEPYTILWQGTGITNPNSPNALAYITDSLTTTATYTATLTDANGCQTMQTLTVNVLSGMACAADGITNPSNPTVGLLALSPNPTHTGSFTIQAQLLTSAVEPVLIQVFNPLGQLVWSEGVTAAPANGAFTHTVNLPQPLPAGMYVVQLHANQYHFIGKLLSR